MRPFLLALLGLTLATAPALAAKRPGPADGGRVVAAKHAVAAPAARGRVAMNRAGRGRVQQASTTHHRPAARPRTRFGWAHGLAPAARIQANECPDGTLSTLADGHEDVVRCMPI